MIAIAVEMVETCGLCSLGILILLIVGVCLWFYIRSFLLKRNEKKRTLVYITRRIIKYQYENADPTHPNFRGHARAEAIEDLAKFVRGENL